MSEVNFMAVRHAIYHKFLMIKDLMGDSTEVVIYMDVRYYYDLLNCRTDNETAGQLDDFHRHSTIGGCRVYPVERPVGYDVDKHPDFVVVPVIQ